MPKPRMGIEIPMLKLKCVQAHYLSPFDLLDGALEGRLKAGDAQQLGGRLVAQ